MSALSCETLESKQLLAADLVAPISADPVQVTDAPVAISLEGKFQDTTVSGTVVKFETNAPLTDNDFYVELTDNTPLTNANFLSYVNSDAYDNSMFHRSVSNFVIQGGGYSAPTVAADQPGSDPFKIPTTGTVQNEPGNLNTRGTISMAKLGGQPDSATSQFFFNLENNSFLDSDNGGYTVFGEVLGSGMTVVDTMAGALTYDATTYYSDTALSDLPLWNVNNDNIVRPNDFVKIENADVVTESDLFTYTVSSSDAAKLTASLDGNGNLVLTPNSGATGSVDVTVTATSRLDNSIASDTFSVQLNGGGPQEPVFTAIASNGNTVLNKDQLGNLFAGDQPLLYNGNSLGVNQWNGFTPIEVEDFGASGGKQLLYRHSSGDHLTWSLGAEWQYSGSQWTSGADSAATQALLYKFGLADAPPPNLSVIESTGTITFNRDSNGLMYAGDQPIYISAGVQASYTFSEYYTPLAIEDLGENGGKQLMLKHVTGNLIAWTFDSSWVRNGNTAWIDRTDASTINSNEALFDFDFDGNQVVGVSFSEIENSGTITFNRDSNGLMYAGDQPIYISAGVQASYTFSEYYTPLAIEDLGENGGKQLMLKHVTGNLIAWTFDSSWVRNGNTAWIDRTDASTINSNEALFDFDFDGNQVVGVSFSEIENSGTITLNRDSNGLMYAGDQPIYISAGVQASYTFSEYYTPLAIEDLGENGGKQLMLKHVTGNLIAWTFDSSWVRNGNTAWIDRTDASTINSNEALFDFDLNSDGISAPTTIEDSGSLELVRDSSNRLFVGDQPIYISAGVQASYTFSEYYTPLAIEDLGENGGKQLMLKHVTGNLIAWTFDSSWVRNGNTAWIDRSDLTSINAKEAQFDFDLNNDSIKGIPPLSPVEESGSTILNRDSIGNLYAGSEPIYISPGLRFNESMLSDYMALATEDFGGELGKRLLLQHSNGNVIEWLLDSNWTRVSNSNWTYRNDVIAFSAIETRYGVDL